MQNSWVTVWQNSVWLESKVISRVFNIETTASNYIHPRLLVIYEYQAVDANTLMLSVLGFSNVVKDMNEKPSSIFFL